MKTTAQKYVCLSFERHGWFSLRVWLPYNLCFSMGHPAMSAFLSFPCIQSNQTCLWQPGELLPQFWSLNAVRISRFSPSSKAARIFVDPNRNWTVSNAERKLISQWNFIQVTTGFHIGFWSHVYTGTLDILTKYITKGLD